MLLVLERVLLWRLIASLRDNVERCDSHVFVSKRAQGGECGVVCFWEWVIWMRLECRRCEMAERCWRERCSGCVGVSIDVHCLIFVAWCIKVITRSETLQVRKESPVLSWHVQLHPLHECCIRWKTGCVGCDLWSRRLCVLDHNSDWPCIVPRLDIGVIDIEEDVQSMDQGRLTCRRTSEHPRC